MAEARAGVAPTHITMHRFGNEVDTSVRRPQVSLTKNGLVVYIPPPRNLFYSLRRYFWHGYTKLRLAFAPLPIPFVVLLLGGVITFTVRSPSDSWQRNNAVTDMCWKLDAWIPLRKYLSTTARMSTIGSAVGSAFLLGFTSAQRFLLRRLLAYHNWMYERREKSLKTKVWGFLLKYVFIRRGASKDLYAFQSALPTQPLPRIEDTVAKYLHTMLPLLNEAEMGEMSSLALEFLRNEGPTLQWYLRLKWLISPNYISDWWLNFVYLRGRDAIAINSNWGGIMYSNYCATPDRVAHASVVCHEFLCCRQTLLRGQLEPQMIADVVPLCMDQYERMFATTRIPGILQDELETTDLEESRHIVVMHKGHFYKVQVYSPNTNRILRPTELFPVLRSIVDSDAVADEHEALMPALTCIDRTTWANVRDEEFLSNPVNRSSLECIEKAAFLLSFEDDSPSTLVEEVRSYLVGNGHNRWADKSMTIVIQKNSHGGVHVEHAWADASTVGHVLEKVSLADEDRRFYNPDGSLIFTDHDLAKAAKAKPAEKLRFQLSKTCCKAIEKAHNTYSAAAADLDMYILRFADYGKGIAKAAKCSPDAWLQMAFQLAYYRDQGRFDQTYESSTARLFNLGRTETIRSASVESSAFVRSMLDEKSDNKIRLDLLRRACDSHQQYTYDCMTGKGVDRHLFALYVVSAGKNITSPFLNKALSRKWKLSTSQVPTRQLPMSEHVAELQSQLETSNGAFGPVADDGYGILYAIWMEDLFYFTITAKKSCPTTDAERLGGRIREALLDMAKLVDTAAAKKDKAAIKK